MAPKGKNASTIAAKIGLEVQHRGQEGGGMATQTLDGVVHLHKKAERFGKIFRNTNVLERHSLKGELAIIQTRYRTTGPADDPEFAQPMLIQVGDRHLIGAHNGNIANAEELYDEQRSRGIKLRTQGIDRPVSDSEVLFSRIANAPGADSVERMIRGLEKVEGSFSIVTVTSDNEMIAARDPWGIRPLNFGRLNGHWVVASETNALDKIGAVEQREIEKGEMWRFRQGKDPEGTIYDSTRPKKFCDLEDWYFLWPSSQRNGIEASEVREVAGTVLADEELWFGRKRDVDLVTCVPDTGRSSAVPFAETLNLPYRDRIFKERYDDKGQRSFIASNDVLRVRILEDKYIISKSLAGKKIYLLDDTAIRLRTMEVLIKALKEQIKVDEVHLRLPAPKFKRPCVLGTNINDRRELGAIEFKNGVWVEKSDEQIADEFGADSVAFLTMHGRDRVREKFGENPRDFCGYCHGDDGPDFDMTRYDPEVLLEGQRRFVPLQLIGV